MSISLPHLHKSPSSSFEADQTSQMTIRLKFWLGRDLQQNYCFSLDWIPERIEGSLGEGHGFVACMSGSEI